MAQGALDLAAKYAAERGQFGRPIGELQMVGGMLADMATQTEVARQLLDTACQEVDVGSPARRAGRPCASSSRTGNGRSDTRLRRLAGHTRRTLGVAWSGRAESLSATPDDALICTFIATVGFHPRQ
ncbi:hypothetical protein BH24ACT5_BH24ACT5_31850 [soil metagenome]